MSNPETAVFSTCPHCRKSIKGQITIYTALCENFVCNECWEVLEKGEERLNMQTEQQAVDCAMRVYRTSVSSLSLRYMRVNRYVVDVMEQKAVYMTLDTPSLPVRMAGYNIEATLA